MAASVGTNMVAFKGMRGLVFEVFNNLAQIVKPPWRSKASMIASTSWFEDGHVDDSVVA